jgi:nitrogen regulatory protein P-II 1
MKEIRAYIQPYVLHGLTSQLREMPGFSGMSVLDCSGIGTERLSTSHQFEPFFLRKRIELIVPDELVETAIEIIIKHAHTGDPGDGRIYISDVQESVHISTQQRSKFVP